jgi:F0F1-type ATP synthase delta subunit
MSKIEGTEPPIGDSRINKIPEPKEKPTNKVERIGQKALGVTVGLARGGRIALSSLVGRVKATLTSVLKSLANKIKSLYARLITDKKEPVSQQPLGTEEGRQLAHQEPSFNDLEKALDNIFADNPEFKDSDEFEDISSRFVNGLKQLSSSKSNGEILDDFGGKVKGLEEDYNKLKQMINESEVSDNVKKTIITGLESSLEQVHANEQFDQLMKLSDNIFPIGNEHRDVLRQVFAHNPKLGGSESFRDVFSKLINELNPLFENTLESLEKDGKIPDDFNKSVDKLIEEYGKLGLMSADYDSGSSNKINFAWIALRAPLDQLMLSNMQALTDSFPIGGVNPEDYPGELPKDTTERLNKGFETLIKETFGSKDEAKRVLGEDIMKGFGPRKVTSASTDEYDFISWVNWSGEYNKKSCRFGMGKYLKEEGKLGPAREVEIQFDLGGGVATLEDAKNFFGALAFFIGEVDQTALDEKVEELVKALRIVAENEEEEVYQGVIQTYRNLLEEGKRKIENSMYKVNYAVNAPDAEIEGVKKLNQE